MGSDPAVEEMRQQLCEEGTRTLEAILRSHLPPHAVEPSLVLLTGGVFARVALQARPADRQFVEDLVDRVLVSAGERRTGR
ncbi:hypothetical protein AWW66_23280 [Micromonospora rosaria]|uniref:Tetracyclin repressor-like C-terminal domain-containing protein n=1 Tax=Micromonospora rosaria TaxID=47874 RepID=A0A136PML3_9ACTN|nr:hypothetical protein [Micromonospora rosaria]KXK59634.1 hypothetical protein AWW66_23280 [Micromonospora rosaria]